MCIKNRVLMSAVAVLGVALLLSGAGCGGGGSAGHSKAGDATTGQSQQQQGRGRVQVTIAWPEQPPSGSRYIPFYANSIYLELISRANGERYSLVATRRGLKPEVQTMAFEELLPVGDYVLAGSARTGDIGGGEDVAFGAVDVKVESGKTANADLTLTSIISRLEIVVPPGYERLELHQEVPLEVRGFGRDGAPLSAETNILLGSAVNWEVVSGNGKINQRTFESGAAGAIRIRATEVGAQKSAEVELKVLRLTELRPSTEPSAYVLEMNTQQNLPVVGVGEDNAPYLRLWALLWEVVSGGDVLSVDSRGLITARAAGTARVRVTETDFGVSTEFDIRVLRLAELRPPTDPNITTVDVGSSVIIPVSGIADNGNPYKTVGPLRWEVISGAEHATVNQDGLVQGITPGAVRIRVTAVNFGVSTEFDMNIVGYGGVNVGVQ